MSESRYLIESLKEKLEEMETDYKNSDNKNDSKARVLKADIEELANIIKGYEEILDKYENMKLDTEHDKKRYEEAMDIVLANLRIYHEQYVNGASTKQYDVESEIEKIANTFDGEEDTIGVSSGVVANSSAEQPRTEKKSSDIEYQAVMNERIRRIEERIKKLKQREKYDITGHTSDAIRGFEIEIAELKQEANNYQNRTSLSAETEAKLAKMDTEHSANAEKISSYEDEIKELEAIRNQLTTRKDKREMKKLIRKLNEQKIDLKIKNKSLADTESEMMKRGYKEEMRYRTKAARQAGIIESNEDSLAINEELRSMLNPDSFIDSIRDQIYDIKGARYRKKIEKAQERLAELQSESTKILITGANTTSLTREYLERIRNRRQSTLHEQESMQMAA